MTSSSTETNRRGVSALSEHWRQDGWTSTPCTCGGSSGGSGSGGCDELAGERLPKQRPHLIEGKKDEEEACLTTAKKREEHPDRNADEHLGARLPQRDEEAGSILFHSSSNTSEIRNDNNESRATASAAEKVSEDILVKDAEILRLIEERRNTPKGEKHKLKDVTKCIKRCISDKKRKKWQMDIQRILEDFKGVSNIPGIKSAKKRVLITSKRNCRCLWRFFFIKNI